MDIKKSIIFTHDLKTKKMAKKKSKKIQPKAYAGGGRIKEIETEIAEYRTLIADKSVPQDEKDFAEGEIKDLEKELAGLKDKDKPEAKAPATPKEKKSTKEKKAPEVKAKAKAPHPAKAKAAAKEKSEQPTCEELEKMWEKRRTQAKKSAKKQKTTSVSEQIGSKMASTVGKVIDDIDIKDIKKNPTKYINAFDKVEEAFKSAMKELKPLLGDDFDEKELTQPFEEIIGKFKTQIKTKYNK